MNSIIIVKGTLDSGVTSQITTNKNKGLVNLCIPYISQIFKSKTNNGIKSSNCVYNITEIGSDVVNNKPENKLLAENLQRLQLFENLEYDWNGNGADKLSSDLINQMKGIVKDLTIQPSIFPTARKSIQFEYENDNEDYLQFELFEDGRLKKFIYHKSGVSSTDYIDINIENINRMVYIFNGR